MALALDLVLVSILGGRIWLALLVLTLGLSLFLLPPLFPLVAFFYNGLTVSGAEHGDAGDAGDRTWRCACTRTARRVPFINAAAHALFFYLSWFFPPIFLVSLVDVEKRCLHDMLAGVTVVRRL